MGTNKKILVVDDSATMRAQVSRALSRAGFDIIQATDGQHGLEQIRSQHRDIGLVICDVNMPRMNGLEMVEAVHREGLGSSFTIVMLTTEGHPDLIRRAKAAGAKGWIVKPFQPEMLVAAAKKLLLVT